MHQGLRFEERYSRRKQEERLPTLEEALGTFAGSTGFWLEGARAFRFRHSLLIPCHSRGCGNDRRMNRVIPYLYGDQNVLSVTSDRAVYVFVGTFGMLSTVCGPKSLPRISLPVR